MGSHLPQGWDPYEGKSSNAKQVLLKEVCSIVGVVPLGQGGRPPDVQVGLEILQTATYIISSKFC